MQDVNSLMKPEEKARRERNWHHYQELEKRPVFADKVQYWRKNGLGFGSVHREEPAFELTLSPQNDSELCQLHRLWLDLHCEELIREKYLIEKAGQKRPDLNPENVAFTIRSLDAMKQDLESRLMGCTRKEDRLRAELTAISRMIDSALEWTDRMGILHRGICAKAIGWLLEGLERYPLYDLTFPGEFDVSTKIFSLALVWDIVHYETYLKDQLAVSTSERNAPVTPMSESTDQLPVKLTHAQIAIWYHIEDWPINKNNAVGIANKYGQTSGQKLEEKYKALSSELDRTATGKCTVKNYQAIGQYISEEAKRHYNRELKRAMDNNQR